MGISPDTLDNLLFWGDPQVGVTTEGGAVSLWEDQGPEGDNATQGTGVDQPAHTNSTPEQIDFTPSDRLRFADSTVLAFTRTTAFSVAMWLNLDAAPTGFMFLFGNQNSAGANLKWSLRGGVSGQRERLLLNAADAVGTDTTVSDSNVFTGTGWQFIAATYDGAGTGVLYVDGAVIASTGGSATAETPAATVTSMGARHADGGGAMNGKLGDVYAYGDVLTADEVQGLYEFRSSYFV